MNRSPKALLGRFAAIDGEGRTRDERRLVGCEKHDGLGDLFGLPMRLSGTPATSPAFRSSLPVNRFNIPVSIGPGATTLTRTPTPLPQVPPTCQPFDRVLAGHVNRGAGCTDLAVGGRHIDDAAATLRKHHAQLMLHAQQRAEHVGVEGGRVALGGLLRQGTGLALGARVVDGHIQPTESRDRLIDQRANFIIMANVGTNVASAPILGVQRLMRCRIVVSTRDDDARAFMRESQSRGTTDSGQRAGDQDNGVFHSELLRALSV